MMLTLRPSAIIPSFLDGTPRSFFIESETRKDLYITNQKELIFKQHQKKLM